MKCEQIKGKDFENVKFLLAAYKFKPYYFLKGISSARLLSLFEERFIKTCSGKKNIVLALKKDGRYSGLVAFRYQAWDTSFFGFPCYGVQYFIPGLDLEAGKLLLEEGVSICRSIGARYLNAKIDSHDIFALDLLQSSGFRVNAAMLHLVCASSLRRKQFKAMCRIRPFEKKDLPWLRKIARRSMSFDHFHQDKHFSKRTADGIYEALIENCCNGSEADHVLVAMRAGKPAGYVACGIRRDVSKTLKLRIGYIRHLAVSGKAGFGCGPGLQEAALAWFRGKADIVESSTTIQNLPILKISVKTGMDVASSHFRLSKWL